jgi:hypothetical protein
MGNTDSDPIIADMPDDISDKYENPIEGTIIDVKIGHQCSVFSSVMPAGKTVKAKITKINSAFRVDDKDNKEWYCHLEVEFLESSSLTPQCQCSKGSLEIPIGMIGIVRHSKDLTTEIKGWILKNKV